MLTRWARLSAITVSVATVAGASAARTAADDDVLGALQIKGYFQAFLREEGARGVAFNQNTMNDGPYSLYKLFVKADAAVSEHVSVFTRLQFDSDASSIVTVDGAYFLFSRLVPADLYLELGKVPSPFGTFAERSYPDKNPLIGIPLMYFYHTTLRKDVLPVDADDLLAVRGQGQFGFAYPSAAGSGMPGMRGLPTIYDPCWDFGVVALGTWRSLEGRFGIMNGAPSSPEAGTEFNGSRVPIARIGWTPVPWLRAGVSGARGAYLSPSSAASLPAGKALDDYRQTALGVDLEASRGWWDIHAELVRNRFETPYITEDPEHVAWYAELRRKLAPGLYAAARWDEMNFGKIEDSSGAMRDWGQDIQRFEAGVGFWPERQLLLKADLQMHRLDGGGWNRDDMIGGVQASLWF